MVGDHLPADVRTCEHVRRSDGDDAVTIDEVLLQRHTGEVGADLERLVGQQELIPSGPGEDLAPRLLDLRPTAQDRPARMDTHRSIGAFPHTTHRFEVARFVRGVERIVHRADVVEVWHLRNVAHQPVTVVESDDMHPERSQLASTALDHQWIRVEGVREGGERLAVAAPASAGSDRQDLRDARRVPRVDPDLQADERTSLAEFLDYHRATFMSRIDGLTHEQLNQRLPPSTLTLASLTKHLALVEDSWFHEDFLGVPLPEPWLSAPFDDDPDWDLHSAADDSPADLADLYTAACGRSREIAGAAESLDTLSNRISEREGKAFSLRWIMLHMIEETARHNGHADFLRESIDGLVGE